jgi:hypothetical protein
MHIDSGFILLAILAGLIGHYAMVLSGTWMRVTRRAARNWIARKEPKRARTTIDESLKYTLITAAQHSALLAEFEFEK